MDNNKYFREIIYNGKVGSVVLILTDEEWCYCCQRDREGYIGPCCGNLAHAQDIMNEAFRDSGRINCDKLEELAYLLKNHDGWCEIENVFDEEKLDNDPWLRPIAAWETVKDRANKKDPFPLDPTVLEDAISIIYRSSYLLFIDSMIETKRYHNKVVRSDLLRRLIPALRTFTDKIKELDVGEFKGVALCKKGTNEIFTTNMGQTIAENLNEAKQIVTWWKEDDPNFKEETVEFRNVTINIENGIVFND